MVGRQREVGENTKGKANLFDHPKKEWNDEARFFWFGVPKDFISLGGRDTLIGANS